MEPLLKAEHLHVCYDGQEVVKDVSFQVNPGESLGIVGESGSGKSTLIKAVMGLLGEAGSVTSGQIWYRDQNLTEMSQREMRTLRGTKLAMIFQDSKASLCPVRKIRKQIREAIQSHRKLSGREVDQLAKEVMKKMGLEDPERILESYPFELSGGMNQRVGIAMAMMLQPSLILADEPTSALDMASQGQVVEELRQMKQESGTAMILVTHNIDVAGELADQILVLKDGEVKEYGNCRDVLECPQDSYTKELLASVLHLKKKSTAGENDGRDNHKSRTCK